MLAAMRREWERAGDIAATPSPGVRRRRASEGFTLLEVVLASAILFLAFLMLFDGLLFCRRMAARLKWRLAADAIAQDIAWSVFSRKTEWFQNDAAAVAPGWHVVPAEMSSAWNGSEEVFYFLAIVPSNSPPTSWSIETDVQWLTFGGGTARLAVPCRLERHPTERNLFRSQ